MTYPHSVVQPNGTLALAYLRTLWPDPPPGYVLLWLRSGRRSLWFPVADLGAIAEAAARHATRTDVYLGCGLSPADYGPARRCEADDVSAIPGLWADVDIAGDTHKGDALPPTLDDALAIVHGLPLPPSLVVRSGHGLQPWWLLSSPWLLADGGRDEAAALVRDWQAHLRTLAAGRGWTLDSTHDLARILRLPGTTNRKGDPLPVTVDLPQIVQRYDVRQLRDALPRTPPRRTPTVEPAPDDRSLALLALGALSPARAADYDSWLQVGMALHAVADDLLDAWDAWSRSCPDKYERGACAAKWATFSRGGGIGLGSLCHWAEEDGWHPPYHRNGASASAPAPYTPAALDMLAADLLDRIRSQPHLRRAYRRLLLTDEPGA
jgi:hypothetical protein